MNSFTFVFVAVGILLLAVGGCERKTTQTIEETIIITPEDVAYHFTGGSDDLHQASHQPVFHPGRPGILHPPSHQTTFHKIETITKGSGRKA